jgi:putative peptide maturation dehydrogenase
MPKVRRTAYAFLYLEDDYVVDARALLRGEVPPPAPEAAVVALALLTGERHRLTRAETELLLSVPSGRWVDDAGLDAAVTQSLTAKALLLSDADEPRLTALREREERLEETQRNRLGAAYHYMTQWGALDLREGGEQDVDHADRARAEVKAFIAEHGPPPPAFAPRASPDTLSLPDGRGDGALFHALSARLTTRAFDTEEPMSLEHLSTALRYVFGCHGLRTVEEVTCIKRTSPSGGGLHPIEVYPVISNVAGVPPGIYHYCVGEHALSLVEGLDPGQGRELATSFMCGQSYFGDAHACFVLTARFLRNHWKYRRHPRAYAGILMDAAHLSQTLYLVSAELGLGAFVTIAINGRAIEERLGLDGVSEGGIAMAGCGPRAPGQSPLEPQFAVRARPST